MQNEALAMLDSSRENSPSDQQAAVVQLIQPQENQRNG